MIVTSSFTVSSAITLSFYQPCWIAFVWYGATDGTGITISDNGMVLP